MELKAAGFSGRYLPEYLAVGEAPEEARNIFRQRSRWCKGHMQVHMERGDAAEQRSTGGIWASPV
jgi:cellulose synthase/poly-beta-1,6-N-acetylglucosamine synthase-like glycosyltransferase